MNYYFTGALILMFVLLTLWVAPINWLNKSKRREKKRSEYEHYQPNNPLTLHYILTGAILPKKEEVPKVVKRKRKCLVGQKK